MKGCDERCTFCVVPTTRGPERYRPSDEILLEVERLVARGARESLRRLGRIGVAGIRFVAARGDVVDVEPGLDRLELLR